MGNDTADEPWAAWCCAGDGGLLGFDGRSCTVVLWTPGRGAWETLRVGGVPPTARHGTAAVVVDRKLVISGGFDVAEGRARNDLFVVPLLSSLPSPDEPPQPQAPAKAKQRKNPSRKRTDPHPKSADRSHPPPASPAPAPSRPSRKCDAAQPVLHRDPSVDGLPVLLGGCAPLQEAGASARAGGKTGREHSAAVDCLPVLGCAPKEARAASTGTEETEESGGGSPDPEHPAALASLPAIGCAPKERPAECTSTKELACSRTGDHSATLDSLPVMGCVPKEGPTSCTSAKVGREHSEALGSLPVLGCVPEEEGLAPGTGTKEPEGSKRGLEHSGSLLVLGCALQEGQPAGASAKVLDGSVSGGEHSGSLLVLGCALQEGQPAGASAKVLDGSVSGREHSSSVLPADETAHRAVETRSALRLDSLPDMGSAPKAVPTDRVGADRGEELELESTQKGAVEGEGVGHLEPSGSRPRHGSAPDASPADHGSAGPGQDGDRTACETAQDPAVQGAPHLSPEGPAASGEDVAMPPRGSASPETGRLRDPTAPADEDPADGSVVFATAGAGTAGRLRGVDAADDQARPVGAVGGGGSGGGPSLLQDDPPTTGTDAATAAEPAAGSEPLDPDQQRAVSDEEPALGIEHARANEGEAPGVGLADRAPSAETAARGRGPLAPAEEGGAEDLDAETPVGIKHADQHNGETGACAEGGVPTTTTAGPEALSVEEGRIDGELPSPTLPDEEPAGIVESAVAEQRPADMGHPGRTGDGGCKRGANRRQTRSLPLGETWASDLDALVDVPQRGPASPEETTPPPEAAVSEEDDSPPPPPTAAAQPPPLSFCDALLPAREVAGPRGGRAAPGSMRSRQNPGKPRRRGKGQKKKKDKPPRGTPTRKGQSPPAEEDPAQSPREWPHWLSIDAAALELPCLQQHRAVQTPGGILFVGGLTVRRSGAEPGAAGPRKGQAPNRKLHLLPYSGEPCAQLAHPDLPACVGVVGHSVQFSEKTAVLAVHGGRGTDGGVCNCVALLGLVFGDAEGGMKRTGSTLQRRGSAVSAASATPRSRAWRVVHYPAHHPAAGLVWCRGAVYCAERLGARRARLSLWDSDDHAPFAWAVAAADVPLAGGGGSPPEAQSRPEGSRTPQTRALVSDRGSSTTPHLPSLDASAGRLSMSNPQRGHTGRPQVPSDAHKQAKAHHPGPAACLVTVVPSTNGRVFVVTHALGAGTREKPARPAVLLWSLPRPLQRSGSFRMSTGEPVCAALDPPPVSVQHHHHHHHQAPPAGFHLSSPGPSECPGSPPLAPHPPGSRGPTPFGRKAAKSPRAPLGGGLPAVSRKVASEALRALRGVNSTRARLTAALDSAPDGVLDLRSLDLECGDYYVLSVCVGQSRVETLLLGDNPPLNSIASKLLLDLVCGNQGITQLQLDGTVVECAGTLRSIQRQLAANAARVEERAAALRERRKDRILQRQLAKDRRKREWTWAQQAARVAVQTACASGALLIECEGACASLETEQLRDSERLAISMAADVASILRRLALHERRRAARSRFVAGEADPREHISAEQEKAWWVLNKTRYDDKRRADAAMKDRTRRERAQKDDLGAVEKTDRQQVKEEEQGTARDLFRGFKATYTQLETKWKREISAAAARERFAREELQRRRKEEEARRNLMDRLEEQKKREQASLYREENNSRFAIGNEAQDERKEVAALEGRCLKTQKALEKEGNARRDKARLNWSAPMLYIERDETPEASTVITTPLAKPQTNGFKDGFESECYVGSVEPTGTLEFLTLSHYVPVPRHLEQGVAYAHDTETVDEWRRRKSEIFRGSVLVHMATGAHVGCPLGVSLGVSGAALAGEGLVFLPPDKVVEATTLETVAVVTRELTPADVWRMEHPVTPVPEEYAGDQSRCGLEFEIQRGSVQTYEAVVRKVTLSASPESEQALVSSTVRPVVKVHVSIEYSAPTAGDDGSREHPASLLGGSVTGTAVADVAVLFVRSPLTVPKQSRHHVFVEGDPPVQFCKGALYSSTLPSSVTMRLVHKSEDDVLQVKDPVIVRGSSILIDHAEIGRVTDRDKGRFDLEVTKSCTAAHFEKLVECFHFDNRSGNPEGHKRTLVLTLSFSHRTAELQVASVVEVVPQDDPTVLVFGSASHSYRRSVPLVDGLQHYHAGSQLLFFARNASVTDVDTEEFATGSLSLHTTAEFRGDDIVVQPAGASGITVVGSTVFCDGLPLGTVASVPRHPEGICIEFAASDHSTISKVDRLLKCVAFTTESVKEGVRTVQASLVVEDQDPVVGTCQVKVTPPLISLPQNLQSQLCKEAGTFKFAGFELRAPDEGWDGGFVKVSIADGAVPGDCIKLGPGEFSVFDCKSEPTGLKDRIRAKINEQRVDKKDDFRLGVLSKIRERKASDMPLKEIRAPNGKVIGTFSPTPTDIMIRLSSSLAVVQSNSSGADRASKSAIRKTQVATLLKQLCFFTDTKRPTTPLSSAGRRVFTVTVSDGLPQASSASMEVWMQPNAPEGTVPALKRKANDAVLHRQPANSRLRSTPVLHDVSVPELAGGQDFSGGYLVVEALSVPDGGTDQFHFMAVEEQEFFYDVDARWAALARDKKKKNARLAAEARAVVGAAGEKRRAIADGEARPRYVAYDAGEGRLWYHEGGRADDAARVEIGRVFVDEAPAGPHAPRAGAQLLSSVVVLFKPNGDVESTGSSVQGELEDGSIVAELSFGDPFSGGGDAFEASASGAWKKSGRAAQPPVLRVDTDFAADGRRSPDRPRSTTNNTAGGRTSSSIRKSNAATSLSAMSPSASRGEKPPVSPRKPRGSINPLGLFRPPATSPKPSLIPTQYPPGAVTPDMVEACLWCIAFSSSAVRAKPATSQYLVRLGTSLGVEGRIKLPITVVPPLLYSCDAARTRGYHPADGWVTVNSKIVANSCSGHTAECRFEASLADECLEPGETRDRNDIEELRFNFADTPFTQKLDVLYHGKDVVGTVAGGDGGGLLRVDFPASLKVPAKVLTALARCVQYHWKSAAPPHASRPSERRCGALRAVEMALLPEDGEDPNAAFSVATTVVRSRGAASSSLHSGVDLLGPEATPATQGAGLGWSPVAPCATVVCEGDPDHADPLPFRCSRVSVAVATSLAAFQQHRLHGSARPPRRTPSHPPSPSLQAGSAFAAADGSPASPYPGATMPAGIWLAREADLLVGDQLDIAPFNPPPAAAAACGASSDGHSRGPSDGNAACCVSTRGWATGADVVCWKPGGAPGEEVVVGELVVHSETAFDVVFKDGGGDELAAQAVIRAVRYRSTSAKAASRAARRVVSFVLDGCAEPLFVEFDLQPPPIAPASVAAGWAAADAHREPGHRLVLPAADAVCVRELAGAVLTVTCQWPVTLCPAAAAAERLALLPPPAAPRQAPSPAHAQQQQLLLQQPPGAAHQIVADAKHVIAEFDAALPSRSLRITLSDDAKVFGASQLRRLLRTLAVQVDEGSEDVPPVLVCI
ncbi:hypothetical protein DIPPA_12879 [Diplonema papillatum]|nr:hypothetical protein DIPPA_12879 [Diplonema papillatum]